MIPQDACKILGPYDYYSVMHYGNGIGSSFAIDPSKPIIYSKGNTIGQKDHLSTGNINSLIKVYGAPTNYIENHDFETGDLRGWTTAGTAFANSDVANNSTWRGTECCIKLVDTSTSACIIILIHFSHPSQYRNPQFSVIYPIIF